MTKLSNAQGRARREEYIRLRLGGLDPVSAAGRLDLPMSTRMVYERWLEVLHPDHAAPREGRRDGWKLGAAPWQ